MKPINMGRLVLLGGIWGMSFIFMRVAAPVFGALPTAFARIAFGAVVLLAVVWLGKTKLNWHAHWRVYLVIGLSNTAVPFSLFAWSAMRVPSAYMATMNAMAPMFTAGFAALLMNERLSAARMVGFVLGLSGVALLVGIGPAPQDAATFAGIGAALLAAACYGYAAVFTRRFAVGIPPIAVATGSLTLATVSLFPLALLAAVAEPPIWPHAAAVAWRAVGAVVLLGVMCTGIAYAVFYRLIAEEGVSRAITVTFLIPATATVWAALFLGERITGGMIAGLAMVLAATALVLGVLRLPAWTRLARAGAVTE